MKHINRTIRAVKRLPENYRVYNDLTILFVKQPHAKTKAEKKKKRGMYGYAYMGDDNLATPELLRMIGTKRNGFIIISENTLHKEITYVVV
jgi:hypothetical protein